MRFNSEIEIELRELGFKGKLVEIPEKDKGKPEDWMTLEKNITYRVRENEIMLTQSELIAAESALY